jgi:hypothetical protein
MLIVRCKRKEIKHKNQRKESIMKNTINEYIINYKQLPQALRLAAAKDAVSRVRAGENATDVAKAFGTTLALVNSWVKRDAEGTLGKRLHDDKVTSRVDHRNLPNAVREAGRKLALEKIKKGNTIAKTAREQIGRAHV